MLSIAQYTYNSFLNNCYTVLNSTTLNFNVCVKTEKTVVHLELENRALDSKMNISTKDDILEDRKRIKVSIY